MEKSLAIRCPHVDIQLVLKEGQQDLLAKRGLAWEVEPHKIMKRSSSRLIRDVSRSFGNQVATNLQVAIEAGAVEWGPLVLVLRSDESVVLLQEKLYDLQQPFLGRDVKWGLQGSVLLIHGISGNEELRDLGKIASSRRVVKNKT